MPLKGLKVIELGGLAPGPLCGKFLRDFGASVIVVHNANSGKAMTPDTCSRGKKSIKLNLKSENGVHILRRLTNSSDILLDPFRKGVLEKLKLGPDLLLTENPRLIYARLSGYGQEGYYSSSAGHDINYLSLTGILSMCGWRQRNPTPPVNFSVFAGGSLMCFTGIILALLDRLKTGKGQVIDCNITEGIAYTASWLMLTQRSLFSNPRGQNWMDGGAHFYDTYETKDGRFMAVGALEPQFYEILLSKLNLSIDEVPQFGKSEDCRIIFQKKFMEKTQEEWTKIFDLTDACVTPVLTIEQASEHQHNKDRKSFIKYDDGSITAARHPRLSTYTEPVEVLPIPAEGAHTVEILTDLGYTDDEIENFCKTAVVEQSMNIKI